MALGNAYFRSKSEMEVTLFWKYCTISLNRNANAEAETCAKKKAEKKTEISKNKSNKSHFCPFFAYFSLTSACFDRASDRSKIGTRPRLASIYFPISKHKS
jgi:hypothetical protein